MCNKIFYLQGDVGDKNIIIVDDSIVRGTTLKKLAKLLKESGVKKVHVRITSPPVKHPCFYGMNFPTQKELVAHNRTTKEIKKMLEVDSLEYLSLDGLLESVKGSKSNFCTACFSGNYPVKPE